MKIDFIRHLVSEEVVGSKIPILCNQENFILRDNSYKILNALPDYQVLVNPAVKLGHDLGRPKNGMFVAFPQAIKNCVTDVSPGFWRIQAAKFKFGNSTILLINSYFPTDPRRVAADDSELIETLSHIKEIIRKNEFSSLLWAGDINADFIRDTRHSRTVHEAVEELGLTKSWQKFDIDFTHCHEQLGMTYLSILDHFFWSETLDAGVRDAGVLHLPCNTSDHSPVYCVVEVDAIQQDLSRPSERKPRPSWKKASQEQKEGFKEDLDDRLSQLTIPASVLSCRDMHCTDINHKQELSSSTRYKWEVQRGFEEEVSWLEGSSQTF